MKNEKKENYGRCETCRKYGKTILCGECNEGSEYESLDYHDARQIVMGLERKVAPVPYDNDYANNEVEHLWFKVNTPKEMEALSTLYDAESKHILPDFICVIESRDDFCGNMEPDKISEEDVNDLSFRMISLSEAEKCFRELKLSLVEEKIILLNDLEEGCIDAVILSTTSTGKNVSDSISNAKDKIEDWQFEDLIAALPKDCHLITKWSENLETVVY